MTGTAAASVSVIETNREGKPIPIGQTKATHPNQIETEREELHRDRRIDYRRRKGRPIYQ